MKPHRRRKSPPRRKNPEGGDSAAGESAGSGSASQAGGGPRRLPRGPAPVAPNQQQPVQEPEPVAPVEEPPPNVVQPAAEEHPPNVVPPAGGDLPNVVPPAAEPEVAPDPVPPVEEQAAAAPEETIYDYTQGGDQPQVYHQPEVPSEPEQQPPTQDPFPTQVGQPAPEPATQQPAAPIDPFQTQNLQPAEQPAQPQPPAGLPPRAARRTPNVQTGSPGGPGGRRPAVGGAAANRPGYIGGRPNPALQQTQSGSSVVFTVLLMIVAVILLIGTIVVMAPQNLDHIKGYGAANSLTAGQNPRNLLSEGQQALLNDGQVTFSEEDVNKYIASRLKGNFKAVCVDFENGAATIYVKTSFMGVPMTLSDRVTVRNNPAGGESWVHSTKVGNFSGFGDKGLAPVLDVFLRLAKSAKEELTVINSMSKVKFQNDAFVLDAG
ncbi:MAG: hypothetical protein HKN23_17150 [Verrucomicrobiales bacterium]|nr:hypothetical protein [Verrucomicrobiales bacterium]